MTSMIQRLSRWVARSIYVLTFTGVGVLAFGACDTSPSATTAARTIQIVSQIPDTSLTASDDTLYLDLREYFSQVNDDSLYFRVAFSGSDLIHVSVGEQTGELMIIGFGAGEAGTVNVVAFDRAGTYLQLFFNVRTPEVEPVETVCPPDPGEASDSFFPLGPGYSETFSYVHGTYYGNPGYQTRRRGTVHLEYVSTTDCVQQLWTKVLLRETRSLIAETSNDVSFSEARWVASGDTVTSTSTIGFWVYADSILMSPYVRYAVPWRSSETEADTFATGPLYHPNGGLESTKVTFVRDAGLVSVSWRRDHSKDTRQYLSLSRIDP